MANDVRQNMVLDGDIAFNVDHAGNATRAPQTAVRERRIDMLGNPVAIGIEKRQTATADPGSILASVRLPESAVRRTTGIGPTDSGELTAQRLVANFG